MIYPAHNNEYDVRVCFDTHFVNTKKRKWDKKKEIRKERTSSGLKMCATPHVIDILLHIHHHHIIHTILSCICSKIAFMRDIWCRVASETHIHWNCLSCKLTAAVAAKCATENETILETRASMRTVLTNWNKMQWIIVAFYSLLFPLQSTCETIKLGINMHVCIS